MSELTALIPQFLAESYENVDQLDRALVELERDPTAPDKLASIFRTVHSIRGANSFFGFSTLAELTRSGESLLSRLRDGTLFLETDVTNGLLDMVDAVRLVLSNIESTGGEGDEKYTALIERLTSLRMKATPTPHDLTGDVWPAHVVANLVQDQEDPDTAAVKLGAVNASPLATNIRVEVERLDKLMDLVGELVLARNQILQFGASLQDVRVLGAIQRLSLITTALQEGIMKVRLQPIDSIWNKFPRVVRDLADLFDKSVTLEMEGSDTELDRTIIEAIRDPLTHLVRNCVDHGLESPATRVAAGKGLEGRVLLRAFHEGGQVNIEISDDGAGMDGARLKGKAVDLGLITSEQAQQLDERAAMSLIFLPGFSTAAKVSDVSGRGVGMDVVKTNIEKIGGTIDIESKVGEGTTFRMTIPLTLTIVPALIVGSGGQRYAIPQASVLELVRLDSDKGTLGIEIVHGAPVYRLRESLLPVVYLNHELQRDRSRSIGASAQREDRVSVNLVVLRAAHRTFGLVVDAVSDISEIVVKPLHKMLKGVSTFAGATIMGDGKVALILDVAGLAGRAHILSHASSRTSPQTRPSSQVVGEHRQRLLIFTVAGEGLMAIPLSLVTRLEEFPRALVERTGASEVVQYQGQILPLIDLSSLAPDGRTGSDPPRCSGDAADKIPVVVSSGPGRLAGLKVERILDIVEEPLSIQYPPRRKGSLGSAVIQGRVTEILDMRELLNMEASRTTADMATPAGRGPARHQIEQAVT
jgi:two-component system, chemotaxis family, sensor kinase CheA